MTSVVRKVPADLTPGWDSGTVRTVTEGPDSPQASRECTPEETLDQVEERFRVLREWTREQVQGVLDRLSGRTFTCLAAKQAITQRIRDLLRRADLRVCCPECGQPATLKAVAAGKGKQGVFQFDHATGGRRSTHRGSTRFPEGLRLVDAPPDGRFTVTPASDA